MSQHQPSPQGTMCSSTDFERKTSVIANKTAGKHFPALQAISFFVLRLGHATPKRIPQYRFIRVSSSSAACGSRGIIDSCSTMEGCGNIEKLVKGPGSIASHLLQSNLCIAQSAWQLKTAERWRNGQINSKPELWIFVWLLGECKLSRGFRSAWMLWWKHWHRSMTCLVTFLAPRFSEYACSTCQLHTPQI